MSDFEPRIAREGRRRKSHPATSTPDADQHPHMADALSTYVDVPAPIHTEGA